MHSSRGRRGGGEQHAAHLDSLRVPGKQTLVEQLQPSAVVQRRTTGAEATVADAAVHDAASRGVATPAAPLPFRDTIQRAFGRHDISGVHAHTGPEAEVSARAMGAQAYATGNHVVMGAPAELHTIAHEAAHVVQQRGGVQLKGGVGEPADPHERHADAVADAVVSGRSAEPLLDSYAGSDGGGIQRSVVQRMESSEGGGRTEGGVQGETKEQSTVSRAEVVFERVQGKDIVKQGASPVSDALAPVLQEYVRTVNYNSLEDATAFVDHLHEKRASNSEMTPQEAFKDHQTDSLKPIGEGKGGQCVGQGIDIAARVRTHPGYPAYPVAAQFPNRAKDKIHTHGAAMVAFANPAVEGDEGYVLLDPGFNVADPIVVKKHLPAQVRSNIYSLHDGEGGAQKVVSQDNDSNPVVEFPANDRPTNPESISKMALLTYKAFTVVNRAGKTRRYLSVDLNNDQFKLVYANPAGKQKVELTISTENLEDAKRKISAALTDGIAQVFGYPDGPALCTAVFKVLDAKTDILSLQNSKITD